MGAFPHFIDKLTTAEPLPVASTQLGERTVAVIWEQYVQIINYDYY